MLELRFVRENLDLVRRKSLLRGVDPQLIDRFAETDNRRLVALTETEALKNQRNTVSKTYKGSRPNRDSETYRKASDSYTDSYTEAGYSKTYKGTGTY